MKLVERETRFDKVAQTGYRQTRYQDEKGKESYLIRALSYMIVEQAPKFSKDATLLMTLLTTAKNDARFKDSVENVQLLKIAEDVFDEWNDTVHAPKAEEPKAEEPKKEEPKVEEPKAEEQKEEEPKEVAEIKSSKGAITNKEVNVITTWLSNLMRIGLDRWKASEKWISTIAHRSTSVVEVKGDNYEKELQIQYDIGYVLSNDFTINDLKERAPNVVNDFIMSPLNEDCLQDDDNAHWEATDTLNVGEKSILLTITVKKTANTEQDLEGIDSSRKIDSADKSMMQNACARAYRELRDADWGGLTGKVKQMTIRQVTMSSLNENEAMWRVSVYLTDTDPRYPEQKLPVSVEDIKAVEYYFNDRVGKDKELNKSERYKYTVSAYGSQMSQTEPHKGGFYIKLTKEDVSEKNDRNKTLAQGAMDVAKGLFGLKNKGKPNYS